MANLFPTEETKATPEITEAQTDRLVKFPKSWKFDFDTGEFVFTPTGKIIETQDMAAWLEWCKKALQTTRYRHLIYSRNYGQEFEDLISRYFDRAGNESEIKRITTECLMVDPRTSAVKNFTFDWISNAVYFTCEVLSVRDELGIISGSVVLS